MLLENVFKRGLIIEWCNKRSLGARRSEVPRRASVRAWFDAQAEESLFVSALTVGEIRQGIETVRRKDAAKAFALESWF